MNIFTFLVYNSKLYFNILTGKKVKENCITLILTFRNYAVDKIYYFELYLSSFQSISIMYVLCTLYPIPG